MNRLVKVLAAMMALLLCLGLTACAGKQGNGDAAVNYSLGLTTDGRFEGIAATAYVTLGQYTNLTDPEEVTSVKEEDIQTRIDSIMSSHTYTNEVTDRAVKDGDTLNIDYVGKVDGVAFEGGSTDGNGTQVTIGVTSYIDDFLEQLIGHRPGETFDIEVTVPDPYENNPDLAGKDAVFTVTVNHIVETYTYELTDDFVADNLQADYGYTSIADMREKIAADLHDTQVYNYMIETVLENCPVSEVPQKLVDNEITITVKQLKYQALQYNMDASTLFTYYGVADEDAFRTTYEEDIREQISQYLVMMAIAEDAGLIATEQDVKDYFLEEMDTEDYSEYVKNYGYGYIYRAVTFNNVGNYLQEQNPAPAYASVEEIILPAAEAETQPAE